MGQYHYTVNLSAKEYLHPHHLGDGLKLVEQAGWSPGGTNDALHLLLAVSNGRGGGDFDLPPDLEEKFVGRWGGDRIAVVGDYAEPNDLPGHVPTAGDIYRLCSCHDPGPSGDCPEGCSRDDHFFNLASDPRFIQALEFAYEVAYVGDGPRYRKSLSELVEGWCYSHLRGERVDRINARDYPLRLILEAIHSLPHGRVNGYDHDFKKLTINELGLAG